MAGTPRSLQEWVARLGSARLPVLAGSVEALARLKEHEDDVVARDISRVILRDPMLTLSVLIVLQTRRPNRRIVDITTIEHAIMMMGVSPFFRQFHDLPVVEDVLAAKPVALRGFMAVAARARHAAVHARTWAVLRCDIESDEVVIAALLHDMVELLIWFFAPHLTLEIAERMQSDATLRSAAVQRAVLGFPIGELQSALCHEWQMPELLKSLMDEQHAHQPRARNALLAVALARHSAHGWRDAALPDDLVEIGELLGLPREEVGKNIYRAELFAIAELQHYGVGADAIWLPPLPLFFGNYASWMHGAPHGLAPLLLEQVLDYLSGSAAAGPALPALLDHPNATAEDIARIDAIAYALNGIHAGLGFDRVLWLDMNGADALSGPRYVVGGQGAEKLRDLRHTAGSDPELGRLLLSLRDAGDFAQLQQQLPALLREAIKNRNPTSEFVAMPLLAGRSGNWSLIYADGAACHADPDFDVPAQFRTMVLALEARLNDF